MDVTATARTWPDKAKAKVRTLIDHAPEKLVDTAVNGVASASASLVADRVFKATVSKGPVPAVVMAVGGAALTRGGIEAAYAMGKNHYRDKPVMDGVGAKALNGMRKGAINGGITLAARPILHAVNARFPHLTPVKAGALAGSIKGGISSFTGNATNPETWDDGVGTGVLRVGGATAAGLAGGALSGGWGKSASNAVIRRLEPYIDFTSINFDWIDWGSLIDFIKPGN